MRINEILGRQRGMHPGREKIAWDHSIGEPKKKKKKSPTNDHGRHKSTDEQIATWWPHQQRGKGYSDEIKEWLKNNEIYKQDIEQLRQKFITKRKEEGRYTHTWRDKPQWTGPLGYSFELFRREANKIITKALKRYTP